MEEEQLNILLSDEDALIDEIEYGIAGFNTEHMLAVIKERCGLPTPTYQEYVIICEKLCNKLNRNIYHVTEDSYQDDIIEYHSRKNNSHESDVLYVTDAL